MTEFAPIHISPLNYVHIQDLNTNITRLETGPLTLALQRHETLVLGPVPHVIIPPGHYCYIFNPVIQSDDLAGDHFSLNLGHREVRYHRPPFPLYPGEVLGKISGNSILPLEVVQKGMAINLLALDDLVDENGEKRIAGEEYQLLGPLTYKPRVEAQKIGIVKQIVVKENEALKIKAKKQLVDRHGNKRNNGDIWLMRKAGPYIPTVYEENLETIKPFTLTVNKGLHVRSLINHTDIFGKDRKVGDEWLVTLEDTETYIPDVSEEIFQTVNRVVLKQNEYCFILNVADDHGKNHFGKRELRQGVDSFFLNPGESLEKGVQKAYLLAELEAVLLRAFLPFVDTQDPKHPKGKNRVAGERWMIYGPTNYIPTVEIEVLEKREAIALDEQEGIYVRNIQTGAVRVVMGPQCYMLGVEEILFEKELSPQVELLLRKGGGDGEEDIRKIAYFSAYIDPALLKGPRVKSRVVKYRIPPGTAVQINDHVKKTSRFIFGPEMALLQPHEDFMVFSLSAGKPKKPGALKSLVLMLGPDFITDMIKVETSDHAVLNIMLSYNNEFIVDQNDLESVKKIFSVPDFIGYACSMIGAKIREHVAQCTFDQFHRHSNTLIEEAVFHRDEENIIKNKLLIEANNMVISDVDVHSIEPADPQMLASLTKSVQMAIEIATKSIETTAKHEAEYEKQTALGALDLQKLSDAAEVEKARKHLLETVEENAAIETCGTAIAEARAHAEKLIIEGESEVKLATLRAQAKEIEELSQIEIEKQKREAEISFFREITEIEIQHAKNKADIEIFKIKSFVESITREALVKIASAGPRMQAKLLESLGIQSTLITDGKSPINLFNTAQGLIANSPANVVPVDGS